MSSSFRGSSALLHRVTPLLLSGVLLGCTFPDYAFPGDSASTGGTGGVGGTPLASAGRSGSAGASSSGSGGNAGGASAGNGGASAGNGGASAGNGGANAGNGGASGMGLAGMGAGGSAAAGTSGGGAAGSTGGSGSLFSDDFESGQSSAWVANLPADWAVVSTSSTRVYRQGTSGDVLSVSAAGNPSWTDQALEARLLILSFGGSTTSDLALLAVRFRDADNFYYAALRADGKVVLKARLNGSDSSLGASVSAGITTNTWYTVKVIAAGNQLSLYLDGALIQSVGGVLIPSGSIALGTNNATVEFDDVRVTVP